MNNKKIFSVLISFFAFTLLTNCASLERPKPTGHLIKDQTFVQQTAGQSFIRMTDKNGTAIHTCTMPQPDATFSVTTEEVWVLPLVQKKQRWEVVRQKW